MTTLPPWDPVVCLEWGLQGLIWPRLWFTIVHREIRTGCTSQFSCSKKRILAKQAGVQQTSYIGRCTELELFSHHYMITEKLVYVVTASHNNMDTHTHTHETPAGSSQVRYRRQTHSELTSHQALRFVYIFQTRLQTSCAITTADDTEWRKVNEDDTEWSHDTDDTEWREFYEGMSQSKVKQLIKRTSKITNKIYK